MSVIIPILQMRQLRLTEFKTYGGLHSWEGQRQHFMLYSKQHILPVLLTLSQYLHEKASSEMRIQPSPALSPPCFIAIYFKDRQSVVSFIHLSIYIYIYVYIRISNC